jgi:hypothetical protein
MSAAEGQLAVVIAPDTAAEASRHFAALLAAGYHPVMDYGAPGRPLGNFPVLAPLAEAAEAKAFLKGLRAGQPALKAPSMFDPGLSDRPVGPIPPWRLHETVGKAVGVIVAMLVLAGALVALIYMLQFLTSLKGH